MTDVDGTHGELVLTPTTPGEVWAALVGLLEPTSSTPAAV